MTGFGVPLRIVLTHWPKAFQALNSDASKWHECLTQHRFHAKSSKLARRGGFCTFVRPLPNIDSWRRSRSPKRGPTHRPLPTTCVSILGTCSLRVFLTILTARLLAFEGALTSCFVPDCSFSVLRTQTLECVRVVPIPLVELRHQLPGHHRFEFNAERKLDTIVRTPKDRLHNLAFLYQRSDKC